MSSEKKGYIYSAQMSLDELKDFLRKFFDSGEVFTFLEDLSYYKPHPQKDIPSELAPKGRSFNSDKGEVRWERLENGFRVMVFSEKEIKDEKFGLNLVLDNCELKTTSFYLIEPKVARYNLSFDKYPDDAKKAEGLIYLKEGVSMFLTLRRLII